MYNYETRQEVAFTGLKDLDKRKQTILWTALKNQIMHIFCEQHWDEASGEFNSFLLTRFEEAIWREDLQALPIMKPWSALLHSNLIILLEKKKEKKKDSIKELGI